MKTEYLLRTIKGQSSLDLVATIAIVGISCVVMYDPVKKALTGGYVKQGHQISTMEFSEESTGNIGSTSLSTFDELNNKGNIKQTFAVNTNNNNTSVVTAR